MSNELADVALRHIKAEVESQKRELEEFYAELKIKLPKYLKTCTIDQVRSAGGIVGTTIHLPKSTVAYLKAQHKNEDRREEARDKIIEELKLKKKETFAYYEAVKSMIPEHLRKKKLCEITEEDMKDITIDLVELRTRRK